jgi:hypothetical protein
MRARKMRLFARFTVQILTSKPFIVVKTAGRDAWKGGGGSL